MAPQTRAPGGLAAWDDRACRPLPSLEREAGSDSLFFPRSAQLFSASLCSPDRSRPRLPLVAALLVCCLCFPPLCPEGCSAVSVGSATWSHVLESPSMLFVLRPSSPTAVRFCRFRPASTVPSSLTDGENHFGPGACTRLGFVAPPVAKTPHAQSTPFSPGRGRTAIGGPSCGSLGNSCLFHSRVSKKSSTLFSSPLHKSVVSRSVSQNASVETSGDSDHAQLASCLASSRNSSLPSLHTAQKHIPTTSRLSALHDDTFSPGASSSPARSRRGGSLRHAEMSVNRVTLLGRLGAMPEIRRMSNGDTFAWFSMATSVNWIDKATGDAHSRTEWHRVVVYDEALVDLVDKYLHTGRRVFVTGKLQTRRWTGADGVDRYSTSVVVSRLQGEIIILDSPSSAPSSYSSSTEPRQPGASDWAAGDVGVPGGEGSGGDEGEVLGSFGDSGDGQGASGPSGGAGRNGLDGSAAGGMYRLFR
uniref:Single-stranded DNA-binding protein n=1 Tax=Neospora caninum (strain Liverpool) TaxID=572307 RepID=A0A0F7U852_NEOCL|nr:TPA: Single-stranded DNA-binding protein [Neospora caninum Liverpool]